MPHADLEMRHCGRSALPAARCSCSRLPPDHTRIRSIGTASDQPELLQARGCTSGDLANAGVRFKSGQPNARLPAGAMAARLPRGAGRLGGLLLALLLAQLAAMARGQALGLDRKAKEATTKRFLKQLADLNLWAGVVACSDGAGDALYKVRGLAGALSTSMGCGKPIKAPGARPGQPQAAAAAA